MDPAYLIKDDALKHIENCLTGGDCWIVFNTHKYFLEKADVFTFRHQDEAEKFCRNEITQYEPFEAVRISSVKDLLRILQSNLEIDKFIYSTNNLNTMEEKGKSMEQEHMISAEALQSIENGLAHGKSWLAYDTYRYFLEKDDVRIFKHKDQAHEFCAINIRENKLFSFVQVRSMKDVELVIQLGELAHPIIQSLNNTNTMEEKIMSFNEKQLQRTGFAEAFTPELLQKMEQRVPVIEHAFKKDFDGDKVNAVLHLRKSESSDHYHLNKFDLSLQKEGQLTEAKHTFYVNAVKSTNEQGEKNPDNLYTLKEGYNLLAGRPVFKHMTNFEGNAYDSWVQLNLKNKLESGNFEMKQYTKNYGFELEAVLNKYPIKELTNEQYKANLIDSLNRGNLQKATFVGAEGKEEKLYISPVVTMGQLNVYDLDKQRIPTDKLLERGLVGSELAAQLKERLKDPPSGETKIAHAEKVNDSQKPAQKQVSEQKQQKQKVKHKAH